MSTVGRDLASVELTARELWQGGPPHELFARIPRIAPEHGQLSVVRSEPKNRIERGGLARAIGTDQSEDAALFHAKIDIVQRDGCAENFAETACFYRCHND